MGVWRGFSTHPLPIEPGFLASAQKTERHCLSLGFIGQFRIVIPYAVTKLIDRCSRGEARLFGSHPIKTVTLDFGNPLFQRKVSGVVFEIEQGTPYRYCIVMANILQ
ncbi:hypothetical protein [Arthrobacter cavernae]|uniref:Uncharacterized protein n=1 Tax=Arthrobacter cavernae TaxID=2817681 RepID=A0A939HIJ1_9MICC|nr:hypothetical protein [Arthrobacter cavernae]MBO1269884.1 hypothetical protein [Arthrobacter cavernae]